MKPLPSDWVKLNLGCNVHTEQGWVNVDKHPFPGVDKVVDLDKPWPWETSSVHYIRAIDIFEHLRDSIHTMNEAYRVLKPGGILEILVPSTDGRGAFQDPTHVSFWNVHSFSYYSRGKGGRAHLYPHLINCDFQWTVFNLVFQNNVAQAKSIGRAIKPEPPVVHVSWFNDVVAEEEKHYGQKMGTTEPA